MSISSRKQLLEDDQVIYESIDEYNEYIDMKSLEQASPYVHPTAKHSPIYSNSPPPGTAAMPPSHVPHPRPRIGPKPVKLQEVLLKPHPPATPPPDCTRAVKQMAKSKPVMPIKKAPPTPPQRPLPPPLRKEKEYTCLSPAGTIHPPPPHDYESLRPRVRHQVMKRYTPGPRRQSKEKQEGHIPLQDLYDDGKNSMKHSDKNRFSSSTDIEKDDSSESTRADSSRVVCLLLTIIILALLIAVASFITTMYAVTSVERLKSDMLTRRCSRHVLHHCNSSVNELGDGRVLCPPEAVAMEMSNEQSISCEATVVGQLDDPSVPFIATAMRYSNKSSTYVQCACFFIPNDAYPPPLTSDPFRSVPNNSNYSLPINLPIATPTPLPPMVHTTEQVTTPEPAPEIAVLNCTMIKTHCT